MADKRSWSDGFVVADRRPGTCLGCGEPYKPRVAEAICPGCVASIVQDPDTWLNRILGHGSGHG